MKTVQIGLRWSGKVAGGAERVYVDLASSLPNTGVEFVGAVAGDVHAGATACASIYSFARDSASTTARLRGIRNVVPSLLNAEKPDVLGSHFALYTAPILDKLNSLPFVMHFHGPWALEAREEGASKAIVRMKSSLERAVYRRADRVIVLSEAFKSLINQTYGVPLEKISIVPGAVDLDRFEPVCSRAEARKKLHWPVGRPILLSVRRLVQRMGLIQLVEAISILRKKIPEILLYIGGNGPLRPALEKRVHDLGLEKQVTFVGFIPDEDLSLAYRAADLTIVPTAALEGFGLVAAESLAAGTPTMVTPIGGLPEIVRPLSPKLIFEDGSPEALSGGLSGALTDGSWLPTDLDCRAYVARNFSKELMAQRVAEVYRDLLGNNQR